jgi:excisionase family DNA binding protein
MPKITKEEAAQILEKSTRAIERYSKAEGNNPPLLSVTYEKGKTRDVPMYDEGEVRDLAERLKHPQTPARATLAAPETAIATRSDNGDMAVSQLSVIVRAIEQAREESRPRATISDLAHKLMLSLDDAAQLAGLSRDHLRAAIKAGKLKGRIIGRGFKVKRPDLEQYVKKL